MSVHSSSGFTPGPHPGSRSHAWSPCFPDSDRGARQSPGGAEAPGETVTTTNSLTSCPLRVGRASTRSQTAEREELGEEQRASPRRRCTKARAAEGGREEKAHRMLDSDSRHFGTVSGCSSAGNSRSPKQPHTMGLQAPSQAMEAAEANPPRVSSGLPAGIQKGHT